MSFQPLDWGIAAVASILFLMGLFRGFSGIFAMVAGTVVSAALVAFGWPRLAALGYSPAANAAIAFVAAVVVFGIVRMCVKKAVGSLLAQPADSILGCAIAAACAGLLLLAIASNQSFRKHSSLAMKVPSDAGLRSY